MRNNPKSKPWGTTPNQNSGIIKLWGTTPNQNHGEQPQIGTLKSNHGEQPQINRQWGTAPRKALGNSPRQWHQGTALSNEEQPQVSIGSDPNDRQWGTAPTGNREQPYALGNEEQPQAIRNGPNSEFHTKLKTISSPK